MEKLMRKDSSMGTLSLDILTNIFLLLPVKHLLCLKSVCKSWRSLITSRIFANLHLRQNHLPRERLLVFVTEDHSIYSSSLEPRGSSTATRIPFTSTWERYSRKNIVGSCNGLVLCMCDENADFEALLVNPSTLSRKRVPKLQVPQCCLYLNYGFGYDWSANDYKIVRIAHFLGTYICKEVGHMNREVTNVMVSVYSLGSNSWRLVEHTSPLLGVGSHGRLSQNGAVVNDNLVHWLCSNPFRNGQIACFNVSSDRWSEVPLPDFTSRADSGPFELINLGVVDGSLCLISTGNVWVMKEYGVAESWVQLLDLSHPRVGRSLKCTFPVAYSREGGKILMTGDHHQNQNQQALWYDFKSKRTRIAKFHGLPNYRQVSVCIQTLTPL